MSSKKVCVNKDGKKKDIASYLLIQNIKEKRGIIYNNNQEPKFG